MDRVGARNFLFGFAEQQYLLAAQSLGLAAQVRYAGSKDKSQPANDKYWSRISAQVVSEYQETLRCETRRFCSTGLVFVQLMCPVTDSKALTFCDQLAEMVRNSFRIYQGEELEFTNTEITDNVTAEPEWLRANVVATYQYRQFL